MKYDSSVDAYRITNDVGVPSSVRDIIYKLAELGWLYRRVKNFLDARSGDKALGLGRRYWLLSLNLIFLVVNVVVTMTSAPALIKSR